MFIFWGHFGFSTCLISFDFIKSLDYLDWLSSSWVIYEYWAFFFFLSPFCLAFCCYFSCMKIRLKLMCTLHRYSLIFIFVYIFYIWAPQNINIFLHLINFYLRNFKRNRREKNGRKKVRYLLCCWLKNSFWSKDSWGAMTVDWCIHIISLLLITEFCITLIRQQIH